MDINCMIIASVIMILASTTSYVLGRKDGYITALEDIDKMPEDVDDGEVEKNV